MSEQILKISPDCYGTDGRARRMGRTDGKYNFTVLLRRRNRVLQFWRKLKDIYSWDNHNNHSPPIIALYSLIIALYCPIILIPATVSVRSGNLFVSHRGSLFKELRSDRPVLRWSRSFRPGCRPRSLGWQLRLDCRVAGAPGWKLRWFGTVHPGR